MQIEKGHQALRRGRYDRAGGYYHLTTTTRGRRALFNDFQTARTFIRVLRDEQAHGGGTTLAYCLMPDHLHWLVVLGSSSLPEMVKRVKAVSSRRLGARVWSRGYYDHRIRSDENLIEVARYIVANPLKDGIVTRIEDYPHWDSVWL